MGQKYCSNILYFCCQGSAENMEGGEGQAPPPAEKQIQHRANTTMHVCWHRNTSVSNKDHEKAVKVREMRTLLLVYK